MPRLLLLLSLCAFVTLLAGCGNKGPLVMPTRPAGASTAPPPPLPASATSSPVQP